VTDHSGKDQFPEISVHAEIASRLRHIDQALEGINRHAEQLAQLSSRSGDQERRIDKMEDRMDENMQAMQKLTVASNSNKSALTYMERTLWASITVVLAFSAEILAWIERSE